MANSLDPCLFTGHILDPSQMELASLTSSLALGLYVNDFVYFSEDPAIKQQFKELLS
jgi:hypothetical protein